MLKNLRSRFRYKSLILTVATTCFINCALATVIAKSQDLDKRISIDVEKKTLKETLDLISKQAHIGIIYSNAKGILKKPVTIHAKDQPVSKVLTELLSPLTLTYEIIGDQIVIKLDDTSVRPPSREESQKQKFPIKGKVTDVNGLALPGATIKIKDGPALVTTDSNGEFEISNVADSTILQVSFIGYLTKEIVVTDTNYIIISLENGSNQLDEVAVVSTGYQNLSKERATGSFTLIDNKTLNRAVSTDLLSRLNGVTNGLLIDNNTGNPEGISIRGRSTLFSNTEPLIVIDNFPYEGDINSINPDDIETVTLLKDAAAASIWGVRAGNGVIVITTKKGKANQKPVVSFNTNLTIGAKPNLYYQPQLSSSDYIDLEKYLFNQGQYYQLYDDYDQISPVVAILNQQQLGQITDAQANQQINALRNIDDRSQESKYFYRKSSTQQYHFDVSGGGKNETYYFSGGYDYNLPTAVATSNSRITIKANNSYRFLNDKLTLTTDINFTKSQTANNNAEGYTPLYPYEQVASSNGTPLEASANNIGYNLRTGYTDTAGMGKLLNWKYFPLDELRNKTSTNTTDQNDYRVLLGLNYKIIKPLSISLNYQYENISTKGNIDYDAQSYYTRNMVNSYSQIDPSTGVVTTPIPDGDIYSPSFTNYEANYGRGQINFNQTIANKHEINAIGGFEIRDEQTQNNSTTLYGYNPAIETSALIDNTTQFPTYYGPGAELFQLGNPNQLNSLTNRYISYFGNASYSYNQKYTVSGSYRKDESNLFGVAANQKGVPLWSTGIAWNVDKEEFFKVDWLSTLKLRATYGYNGNVDQNLSAYLTATARGANPIYTNENYSTIVNPPNNSLQWEKVRNINLGFDFSTKNNRISGSLEYYIKDGLDLIGTSPVAPQEGVSTFTGNTADTRTSGIDLQINSININGPLKWVTNFIFNHVTDKVTGYKVQPDDNEDFVSGLFGLNPLVGYPINSIFGFKWKGLDNMGNPQGVLNGVTSEDYAAMLGSSNVGNLDFFGSATPTTFGSIRNTFSYANIEFSFNVTYKLNYYFRRASVNYNNLINGGVFQQADYDLRWQKPDELKTNVPSLIYPDDPNRDSFYQYSSILVDHADQVRLQDIQINYTFTKSQFKSFPFSNLNIYFYANNLGILWRANKQGLDPDVFSGSYPTPRTISIGLKANF